MQQWEYAYLSYYAGMGKRREVQFTNGEVWDKIPNDFVGTLRRLGDQGWELVLDSTVPDGFNLLFKRPKQPAS
jgi:hypothetical protein